MRLRALRVENWRSIRRLEANDLADGVTVLHGPNGTGKSSLMAAIRACLLDVDHDSSSAEIRAAVPLGTNESPEVALEFETGGETYRITKRFSPRKDGFALLERQTGFGWKTEVDDSKQAGRRVREILKAKSSNANWYGLLWLNQGIVELSDQVTSDMDLRTAIINTLGGMVTPHDREIEKILKTRAAQWLTATGRERSKSLLAELKKTKLPEAERRVTELREERRRLEGFITQADTLRRQGETLRREIEQREEEVSKLTARLAQLAPVQEKHAALATQLAVAQEKHQALQDRLEQWEESSERYTSAVTAAKELQAELKTALQEHDACQTANETAEQRVAALTTQLEALQASRQQLESERQLRHVAEQKQQLARLGARRQALLEELEAAKSQTSQVPSEAELKQIAARWRKLQASEAQLAATSSHVEFAPDKAVRIQAEIDGRAVELELRPDSSDGADWHSQAELHLPGWGIVRLSRATPADDELSPETVSAERKTLQDLVSAYGVSIDEEAWLANLSERVFAHQTKVREVAQLTAHVTELDEQLAKRKAEIATLENAVTESGVQLPAADEGNSLTDLGEQVKSVAAELSEQQKQLASAKREKSQAESAWRTAERRVNQVRQGLAVAENSQKHLSAERDKFAELRTVESHDVLDQSAREEQYQKYLARLQQDLDTAAKNVAKREKELHAVEQPADAETLAAQATAAKKQLLELRQQYAQARESLSETRGRISASEGKHAQLAEAEHALEYLRGQLVREQTQVDAHRYLVQLFEDCRQGDIAEMLEPVSCLVARWAREIGMTDFRQVPLNKDFSLDQIDLARGGGEHQLKVAQESFGAVEQLSLLVRLALGGVLANNEPRLMLLDDPLVHADPIRHRQTMQVLTTATGGDPAGQPQTGPLQMMIMTCHPERFAELPNVRTIDLLASGQFTSRGSAAPPAADPAPSTVASRPAESPPAEVESPKAEPAETTRTTEQSPTAEPTRKTVPPPRRRRKAKTTQPATTAKSEQDLASQRGFWD